MIQVSGSLTWISVRSKTLSSSLLVLWSIHRVLRTLRPDQRHDVGRWNMLCHMSHYEHCHRLPAPFSPAGKSPSLFISTFSQQMTSKLPSPRAAWIKFPRPISGQTREAYDYWWVLYSVLLPAYLLPLWGRPWSPLQGQTLACLSGNYAVFWRFRIGRGLPNSHRTVPNSTALAPYPPGQEDI